MDRMVALGKQDKPNMLALWSICWCFPLDRLVLWSSSSSPEKKRNIAPAPFQWKWKKGSVRYSDPAAEAQLCYAELSCNRTPHSISFTQLGPSFSLGAQRSLISDRDLVFEVNTRNKTSDNQRLCSQREDARNPDRGLEEGNLEEQWFKTFCSVVYKALGTWVLAPPCSSAINKQGGGQVQVTCEDATKGQRAPCTRFSLVIGARQLVAWPQNAVFKQN